MTGDLRIIESDIGPVVPVVDIARNVGCSRTTVFNTIRRHPTLFKGVTSSIQLETPSGKQRHTCIAKSALEDLISHLRPLNHDNLPERIEGFRAAQIKKKSALGVSAPLSDVLTEYGRQARVLATEWGVDLPVAQRVVMATAVERFPDLTPYRALVGAGDKPHDAIQELPAPAAGPKADPDYEKYFSLRKLSQFCQCEEKDARKILVDEGVVTYQNTHLVLTKYGERFGRLFTVTPEAPHRMYEEIRIRYSPEAVQLVRGKLASIQMRLPARAV